MRTIKYQWEDFSHPKLSLLREKYRLDDVISRGKDEFEKHLLLKSWVNKTLPLGYNPKRHYQNAFEILEDAKEGGEFNCGQYVLVMVQCATALGWYIRKLGIDTDHGFQEEEMSHTVVDIWSNEFNKWYVIDPNFNTHFEKNKTPLNAYEIRHEWLENKAKDVKKIIGNYESKFRYRNVKVWHDKPSNYFWFFILLRNNYFENPNIYDSKALLWVDEYNKKKTWYKGGKHKGKYRKHTMYKGQFIKTNDLNLCFPRMSAQYEQKV